jgi:hypothetical protein
MVTAYAFILAAKNNLPFELLSSKKKRKIKAGRWLVGRMNHARHRLLRIASWFPRQHLRENRHKILSTRYRLRFKATYASRIAILC